MEGNGAFWVQVVASAGVLTPLVLGILGFIERRSNKAKDAASKGETAAVSAGVAIDPAAQSLADVLRERVRGLEQTNTWLADERNYYYDKCLAAGLKVDPPRVRYVR